MNDWNGRMSLGQPARVRHDRGTAHTGRGITDGDDLVDDDIVARAVTAKGNVEDHGGIGASMRAALVAVAPDIAARAHCPHVVTSDEGTSYCDLAESGRPTPEATTPASDLARLTAAELTAALTASARHGNIWADLTLARLETADDVEQTAAQIVAETARLHTKVVDILESAGVAVSAAAAPPHKEGEPTQHEHDAGDVPRTATPATTASARVVVESGGPLPPMVVATRPQDWTPAQAALLWTINEVARRARA